MKCIKRNCRGRLLVVRVYGGVDYKTQELKCELCGARKTSLTILVKETISARALAIEEEKRWTKKPKRT